MHQHKISSNGKYSQPSTSETASAVEQKQKLDLHQQQQLQFQPPQRSASYQSYHQATGASASASASGSALPYGSTPTSPVLFGVNGAEHWRPPRNANANAKANAGAGSNAELGSIFRRLQDTTSAGPPPQAKTPNAAALLPSRRSASGRIEPMAPAAVASGQPAALPTASTAMNMPTRTVAPAVPPPESPRPDLLTAATVGAMSSTTPGGSSCGGHRSPNPAHAHRTAKDLSPHRGVSSPSTQEEDESEQSQPSDVDESDEFPHHDETHPDLMMPEYGDNMLDQSSIDMDTSHISIIPVSRNLTDAFESMYGVPDHHEAVGAAAAGNMRAQNRGGHGRQRGGGQGTVEEGREDVEQSACGSPDSDATARQQQRPTVTPAAKPAVTSMADAAAQQNAAEEDKSGASSAISPVGVEQLDVEGHKQAPDAQKAEQRTEQRQGQQEQPARQPSRELPKVATAAPQDAPRRASSELSQQQAPSLSTAGGERVVVPFELHPALQLDLPQPVVDRVSIYGVIHDINKEAGSMASHDENAAAGRRQRSSSEAGSVTAENNEPKDEEYSPLVIALNGPPPPREDGAEVERQRSMADSDAVVIDEECWLLSAIASRSPEEVARDRVTCPPPTFAYAIGEQETGEDTHTSGVQGGANAAAATSANPLREMAGSRTQLWKPSRSWWEAKSGKNPWIEPTSHNKRWRYLWPLIHYHKFLAKCIKKLKRNGVDVKTSVSPVSAFLREEVCAISDHLGTASKFSSEEWMSCLAHFAGWTDQGNKEAEARLRVLVSTLKLRSLPEPSDVDSPLLRDQIDAQFLRAMAAARKQMAMGGNNGESKKGKSSSPQPDGGRPPMPPGTARGQQQQSPPLSTIANPMGDGGPPGMLPPQPMYPPGYVYGYQMPHPGGIPPSGPGRGQPPRSNRKGGNKQRRGSRGSKKQPGQDGNDKGAAADAASTGWGGASPPPPYAMDPSLMQQGMFPPSPYHGGGYHDMYNAHNPYYHPPPHHPGGSEHVDHADYYYYQQQQGYHHDPSAAAAYAMPASYMEHPHHWHGQPQQHLMPYDGTDAASLDSSAHSMHGHPLIEQHFSPQGGEPMHAPPIPCTPDQSMDFGRGMELPSPAWAHLDQITANLIATPHQTPSAKRSGRKGKTAQQQQNGGKHNAVANAAARHFVFTNHANADQKSTGQGGDVPPSPATQFAQSQSPAYLPRIQGGRKRITATATATATENPSDVSRDLQPPAVVRQSKNQNEEKAA